MTVPCGYVCDNKTSEGFCKTTACINPLHNNMTINLWIADYVQVVRCKDCKHTNARTKDGEYWHCLAFDLWMSKDFFCADGERKEDGDNR